MSLKGLNVRRSIGKVSLYFFIVTLSILSTLPFLWIVITSLRPPTEVFSEKLTLSIELTIENYFKLFTSGRPVSKAFFNSILISSTTTFIVITLASLSGYALARFELKYKDGFYFFVLTLRIIPASVLVVPYYLMYKELQLLDTIPGAILAYTFINLPFAIWLLRQAFEEIPRSYEEAALIDGCSYLGAFFRVAIRLISPALIATGIFTFVSTWNEFVFALILTRYNALTYTALIPGFFGARRIEWDLLMPLNTIAIIPPLIFIVFARRFLIRGLTTGIVK
jgi:multiple sugar transport system permease protein